MKSPVQMEKKGRIFEIRIYGHLFGWTDDEKIAEEVVRDLRWRWEVGMPLLRQHKISSVKSNRRRGRSR